MLTILVIVAIAVLALVGLASTRPSVFSVQRSLVIRAEPEQIFSYINDFRAWRNWSPYENKDPDMERTLSGAEQGLGAAYAWSGDAKVGAGRMEIIESLPSSKVGIQLDFSRPMSSHCRADFVLLPQGGVTQVTWAMTGPAPFMTKLMGLFMNMDKLIGSDFEVGLANLKGIAEQAT